jgi:hypothetical protein
MTKHFLGLGLALALASVGAAQTILLSDSFSRTIGDAPVLGMGDPLNTDWGPNDNALGGSISQTYEVSDQHTDAGSTWRSGALVDGNKGQLGFSIAEIQHDWATNAAVLAAGKLTVEFDLILAGGAGGGHLAWWFGTTEEEFEEATGGAIGQTPPTNGDVDAAIFFRVGGATGGSRDSGVIVNDSFSITPNMSTTNPNQVRLEVVTGNFQSGTPGSVSMFINGSATPTDINGAAAGTDLNFVWDAEGAGYMGFSRNSSPTLLSIDNLKISVPTVATLNRGDFNGDGRVDGSDLSLLLSNWGSSVPPSPMGWTGSAPTASGIDADELSRLLANWGFGTSTAIPEPTSLLIALMAIAPIGSRFCRM